MAIPEKPPCPKEAEVTIPLHVFDDMRAFLKMSLALIKVLDQDGANITHKFYEVGDSILKKGGRFI